MIIASKTIFFQKVFQLLNVIASPKHPQSLTGFAIAIHKVRGVINSIIAVTMSNPHLKEMWSNSNIPADISRIIKMKAAYSALHDNIPRCIASR